MSLTDFNTPPVKLIMLAVSLVVGLHVLTAVALVAIKPPAPTIELPIVTPPIEIQLLPPPPIEIEEVVIKEIKEEPVKKVKTQPKAKPVAAAKPKVVKKSKPIDKSKSIAKKTVKPIAPIVQKTVEPVVKKDEPKIIEKDKAKTLMTINDDKQDFIVDEPTAAEIADAKKAQEIADAKAKQDKADADAKAKQDKADADAKVKQDKADADAKAKQDRADAKAKEAADDKPVNVTVNASNASWLKKPNLDIPDSAKNGSNSGQTLRVIVGFEVTTKGDIKNVVINKSSGNIKLDREASRQVRSGKLKPFTGVSGAAVVGKVTMPIDYKMPIQ